LEVRSNIPEARATPTADKECPFDAVPLLRFLLWPRTRVSRPAPKQRGKKHGKGTVNAV
jgi:hypothetical protein